MLLQLTRSGFVSSLVARLSGAPLKWLGAVLLVLSYKTLPLAYMLRFYTLVFRHLVLRRRAYLKTKQNTYGIGQNPLDVFTPVPYHTYASPLEIDMYLHKSNSTYLMDLDIARTHFVCKVFQKLFMRYWGNENGAFRSKSLLNCPYVPVGTIQCLFRREITLFQRYTITSSVFAWDHKWLYVILKFELPDGKLCAVAITKYVFKRNGRITMRPRDFLAECDLLLDAAEAVNEKNYPLVSHLESVEGLEAFAASMDTN